MTTTIKTNGSKTELLHHERWEDEGGQTVGIEVPISAGRFVRPMLKMATIQDIPKQWSTKFIIEPFQSGTGSGVSNRNAGGKRKLFKVNLLSPIKGTHHD